MQVIDRALFQRALAGIRFGVKDIADAGRRLGPDLVGAIAEGRGINIGRHQAVGHDHLAEVLGGRSAIGRGGEHGVMVNLHGQTFVTETNGIRRHHIHHIPGDIAGLGHGAQLGHSLAGGIVIDEVDAGMLGIVGFLVGIDL